MLILVLKFSRDRNYVENWEWPLFIFNILEHSCILDLHLPKTLLFSSLNTPNIMISAPIPKSDLKMKVVASFESTYNILLGSLATKFLFLSEPKSLFPLNLANPFSSRMEAMLRTWDHQTLALPPIILVHTELPLPKIHLGS